MHVKSRTSICYVSITFNAENMGVELGFFCGSVSQRFYGRLSIGLVKMCWTSPQS